MHVRLLRAFQAQVLFQAECALIAARALDNELQKESCDSHVVFSALQSLLTAAANMGKAFWGEGKKRSQLAPLRTPLRDSLDIGDDSPLQQLGMRNHFAHFDERLDVWWADSTRHNALDLNLGPTGIFSAFDRKDVFRNFDPVTGELICWGQSFDIRALVAEIERILPRLREEASRDLVDAP